MVAAPEIGLGVAPVTSGSSSTGGFLSELVTILERIDAGARESPGCFIFSETDGATAGAIFVEGGRVCWAAAAGLGRRLSDLLIARSNGNLARPRVEEIVAECRATGAPLGERLVELALVSEPTLKEVLLEHTTESLESIARAGIAGRWIPRRGGYQPKFTFGTGELLACLGRSRAPVDVAALDQLWSVLGESDSAVAFRVGTTALVPIAARGVFAESAGLMLASHRLASGMVNAADRVDPGSVVSGLTDEGRTYISWPHRRLRSIALCEGGGAAARALSRILALPRSSTPETA